MGTDSRRDLSGLDVSLRWGLASLSFGAAFVHFAVMGDHFGESTAHGVFFAVAAWLQLASGLAILVRPSRIVFQLVALLNLALIVSWVVSRTVGVPFGDPAWEAEAIAFPDVLATTFEALTVAACAALLTTRVSLERLAPNVALPALGAVGATVMILSTLSLVPAVAGEHHHGGDATEASGHAHDDDLVGGAALPVDDHHAGSTEGGIEGANGKSPCEQAGPPVSEGQSQHGHRGPSPMEPIEDADVRKELGEQLALARSVAMQYPTAADAQAAGYIQVTGYVPCIGAHWIKVSLMDPEFDVMAPEMLLYDSSGLDGRMVGLSYWAATGPDNPPEGFAGPNDIWHQHIGLCIRGARVVGAESVSEKECKARGGQKADGSNAWMMHAWVVPGWESAWGIFSGEHPELGATVPHPST